MISVLIPVYNFDVRQLVHDLHRQLTTAGIEFEILCFDDGSKEEFNVINQSIINQSQVTLHQLPFNLGRTRIRNALAKAARHPYLLFMDCDSRVVSPNYIRRYVEQLQPGTVLYGGRTYTPTPPHQPELYFHWLYGTRREQISSEVRQLNPYHAFMTNNFLIPKIIFDQIRFNEHLTQYGHEDTLFGMELKKQQIKILHLNNPLAHIGLENTNTFLEKTEQGIQNLVWLSKTHPELETRLLKTYQILQKARLDRVVYFILKMAVPLLLHNIKSKKPDLRLFDLYKLQLLIKSFHH
jgi:glycosyltransferase involved in cell wall biosynthesis